ASIQAAAFIGDTDRVKDFIEGGGSVDTADARGWTPLHWAAAGNHRNIAELLVSNGANINAVEDEWSQITPLFVAAQKSSIDVAKYLIAHGANVNCTEDYPWTPLQRAAYHSKEMVELLLANGADVDGGKWTALHSALDVQRFDIAELLLAKGADVNARDGKGRTPLHYAGWHTSPNNIEIAELLLSKGADIDAKSDSGKTALSNAIGWGYTEMAELLRKHGASESLHDVATTGDIDKVRRLISEGADINAKDEKGQTPLHLVALAGRTEIIELLVAKGADINVKSNTWDTTPLIAALRSGHEDIAKVLIAKGADVNARALGNYTSLHWAACNRARMTGATDIMKLLLAKGADIEARQEHDATPLACATFDGNTESARFLIENGANIEAKLNDGETTPLLRAVSQQHVETAKLLLDKGANIHATWRGLSAIYVAMLGDRLSNRKSDREMVKLLIDRGLESPPIHLAAFFGDLQELKNCLNEETNVDEQDAAGYTPLHCAVCGDHMDVVKFLLSNGANVNAKTTNGWTPLRFIWTVDMSAFLIAKGADVRIADERGTTVLHGAVNRDNHRGDKALIELLLKHGADINARAASTSLGWAGWTPLHVACRNGARDIVELLLVHGADINAKTDKGETPIAIAQSNRHGQVVELLRKHGAKE
ncbi:ankyrin repeat domain-containing protein, partial [Planctomycetota bacterium]